MERKITVQSCVPQGVAHAIRQESAKVGLSTSAFVCMILTERYGGRGSQAQAQPASNKAQSGVDRDKS